MSGLFEFLNSTVIQQIGATVLHSIWQLALISIVVAMILRVGETFGIFRSANHRYLIQCCGLLLMLLAPLTTFFVLTNPQAQLQTTNRANSNLLHRLDLNQPYNYSNSNFAGQSSSEFHGFIRAGKLGRVTPEPAPPLKQSSTGQSFQSNGWLASLAWFWLIGAIGMLCNSMVQFLGAQRLSTSNTWDAPSHLVKLCKKLVEELEIWQLVDLRFSSSVEVPTLIGWLKPVILLPPAMVSGLSARELELILLHELIHIKRHDYLVNVLQSVAESLLFYHPCVWWMSRRIRFEREFAADEQVVHLSQDQITYVQALLQLEQFRSGSKVETGPTLAATDGSLVLRVRRIATLSIGTVDQARAGRAQTRSHPGSLVGFSIWLTRLPVATVLLSILFTCSFILALCLVSETKKVESNPMPRYSDKFIRMQRPDVSFGYADKDFHDLHPWQAPFGMASREIDYDDAWELWCAAADGKADIVKRLVEKDPRLKDIAFRYHCPLDLAVYEGHTQCVKILLHAGTELTEKWGWYGWQRMLNIAAEMGHDEIHDLMVARITETLNYHHDIRLMIQALRDQDIERMNQLVQEDPNRVRFADADGNTALHWAVVARQIPMIDLLVAHGAYPSRRNGASAMPHQVKMWTELEKAMTRGLETGQHATAARERVLELGAEVDFHTAVHQRNFDLVKQMLANAPSLVHYMPGHLGSPLKAAVGNVQMIQLLLDHGADPNMTEHTAPFGCALYTAVAGNHFDSAKLLLENGAEPMQYSDSSGDCLFAANCWIKDGGDRKKMIDLLNEYSGKEHIVIPQRNEKPEHAVAAAAVRATLSRDSVSDWQIGHLLEVILLYRDADLLEEYIGRFGTKATSQIAKVDSRQYKGPLLDRLTELGAKVKPVDTSAKWMGATALHWNDDVSLVSEFVEAGGDINSVNLERQRTALSNAASSGNIEMVRELLKHGADPNLPTRFLPHRP